MDTNVKRVFTEKKPGFDVEARGLYHDLKDNLGISGLAGVRLINRYDLEGLSNADFAQAIPTIFAEPPVDWIVRDALSLDPAARIFGVAYLPGQFDQRADSAAQCIQILTGGNRPEIKAAKLIVLTGSISDAEFERIKEYCINSVESQEAPLTKPASLTTEIVLPENIRPVKGFTAMSRTGLEKLLTEMGLAMSGEDLELCRDYFRDTEQRDPSLTEIRVIDTYWSDHCRHTTFLTEVDAVEFAQGPYAELFQETFRQYLDARGLVHRGEQKALCLMDLATIGMKELRRKGLLPDLELSAENNACSIAVNASIDGRDEEWLVMFKNETHNHPTEIEPFGGAATCLGGAIRDPLSGRVYVYQAMRVTGSGDPRAKIADTLPGKLPQCKITRGAAAGYSSYGNQIGLATGQVAEVYDPGFVAKRMEIGAVIGAAPRRNIRRETPLPGDVVILVGGRTGRDGCGGATGSSKEHTEESLVNCGAEVQKGNPPTERKMQRLFRNPAVSALIKKCNDFGAGGVAVAIGELADGLNIDLDAVPKKYEGLDGTELAISESQERMAVVIAAQHAATFIAMAALENLEATVVARVTGDERLRMSWRNRAIVDISRAFLDSNGAKQHAAVYVAGPAVAAAAADVFSTLSPEIREPLQAGDLQRAWLQNLARLHVCSQKGLAERFDATIGAGTVFMPYGGAHQLSPAEGMAAKLPVLEGETTTGTLMTFGYDPALAAWSPYHGAVYAIVAAVAKIVAMGGDYAKTRLTLQEYFEKLGQDEVKWGKPFAALLGAYRAQRELGIAAIGGKDSMSGTFKDLHVPPTLVAFAVAPADVRQLVSSEFKQAESRVILIPLERNEVAMPDFARLTRNYQRVHQLIGAGKVLAAASVKSGGIAAAISQMCFGNQIGFTFQADIANPELFRPGYGSLLLELAAAASLENDLQGLHYQLLGTTKNKAAIRVNGIEIPLREALRHWEGTLEEVFPTRTEAAPETPQPYHYQRSGIAKPKTPVARPRVFMPVFPGTNCEYDTGRAFAKAGAVVDSFLFRNLSARDIGESLEGMVKGIQNAQIIMIPGGFSAGDEPEGSGKFIATVFRNPRVAEAVTKLLRERDGLILGICNGFQALVKLGLLPYGEIREIGPGDPTLTFNTIGRHVSCLTRTRIASNLSPWLSLTEVGALHTIPVSHGEGRFVAAAGILEQLAAAGQIATQYVDADGRPVSEMPFNPNGSVAAIEGITSPDGRIFGKMGHSERIGDHLYQNVPGNKDQKIFAAGVGYFR